jgi:hypothetical protein
MLTHKPSSLTGQVVGPGVLDAGAEHPAGVVAVALAEESAAVPDKRAGQGRPGADAYRLKWPADRDVTFEPKPVAPPRS